MTHNLKLIEERDRKAVEVEIIGTHPYKTGESLKTFHSFWHVHAKFEIESNKKYSSWTLSKIIRPQRFSWEKEWHYKVLVALSDGEQTSLLSPNEEPQTGVTLEKTEPVKISEKEAKEIVAKGAFVFEIDGDGKLGSLAVRKV